MKHWSLARLDIIGFSSVLEKPTLPRVLAPVFRERETGVVLLPPLCISGDEVFNATPSNMDEAKALVGKSELTLLPEPHTARLGHDLWVNAEGEIAYDPKTTVKRAFESIFGKHMRSAEACLAARDYAGATQHAAVARAVKPNHLEPLVIRGAVERALQQVERFTFTRHLAEDHLPPGEFELLVATRVRDIPSAEARGAAVMMNVAVRKPRFVAEAA